VKPQPVTKGVAEKATATVEVKVEEMEAAIDVAEASLEKQIANIRPTSRPSKGRRARC
jgi:hypothetical protein